MSFLSLLQLFGYSTFAAISSGMALPYVPGLGDGRCDSKFNSEEFNYDEGDCLEFNELYPGCKAVRPWKVGDGKCNRGGEMNIEVHTKECGFDGGDCQPPPEYPNCKALHMSTIGDGICDSSRTSWDGWSEECGWDGGDCINRRFPNCDMERERVGDGVCDYWLDYEFNTTECGFDGGDCVEPQEPINACTDSTLRARVQRGTRTKWKTCSWVARKYTKRRCRYPGIRSHCPGTCDDDCHVSDNITVTPLDSDATFKVYWGPLLRTVEETCAWVAAGQEESDYGGNTNSPRPRDDDYYDDDWWRHFTNRCGLSGVRATCRNTCQDL